jgi:hypothetical protein
MATFMAFHPTDRYMPSVILVNLAMVKTILPVDGEATYRLFFETGTPVTVHGDFATLCEALKEAGVLK